MSRPLASLLPQIVNTINEYGITVQVLRDVYENELGVTTLKESGVVVNEVTLVIDNSAAGNANNRFKTEGVIRPQSYATIYYAYDENINLQREDYFILDNIKYILDVPQNILHYNLLYQANVEVTTP